MASIIRRAGAEVLRTIARTLDPAAEANRVQLYSKAVGGVPQMFARSPDFARQLSGIECSYFDRPLVSHQYDDEFESTTLDAAWTRNGGWSATPQGGVNPFTAVNPSPAAWDLHTNYRQSWIVAQPGAGGTFLDKPIPAFGAGSFFVYARFSTHVPVVNIALSACFMTLRLSNSPFDTNNQIYISMSAGAMGATNNYQVHFGRIDGGVNVVIAPTRNLYATNTGGQPLEGVGLQRVGTTYNAWAFTGTGAAVHLGSYTSSVNVVPALVRVDFGSASTTSPGTPILGCDFVRFREGALFLP